MLAVILIIGVMMAIAFGAFTSVREQAWRARSRDLARQLAHAWNQYLLVNRAFPPSVPDTATPEHLRILNTNQTPGNLFLELKRNESQEGLKDKWGALYHVRLDTDYNGMVDHPFSNVHVRASVIVWSDRFGNPSGPQYTKKTEDDIVVW
jgi:hypothetical protein